MPKMSPPLANLEEAVWTGQKKFVSYKEAMKLYSLGRHTIEELAEKAGAKYHVKTRVLINTKKMDEYMENLRD